MKKICIALFFLLNRLSHCIVIKPEIVRTVPGLGIFKHYAVTVISMAGNDRHAIIIIRIHLQILFINLRHFFYRHDSFTVYNCHMQCLFQILINRIFRNFFCKIQDGVFQKLIMIQDQRQVIDILQAMDIVNIRSGRKACIQRLFFINCKFRK